MQCGLNSVTMVHFRKRRDRLRLSSGFQHASLLGRFFHVHESVNLYVEECALRKEKSVMQRLTTTVELTSKGQRGGPDERRDPRDR